MKACIACKHFELSLGWAGGDVTPGDDGFVQCKKDMFPEQTGPHFYAGHILAAALTCPHFEVSDLAKSKGWPA